MKNFKLSVLIFFVFSVFVLFGEKNINISPREKAPINIRDEYIFVDSDTPRYILKSAVLKGLSPAFFLKGSDGEWMRKNLDLIKKSSPVIFVDGNFTKLEKKYFDELVKFTDFRAQIICISDNCNKKNNWRHPLIKRLYTVVRDEEGNIVMTGLGKTSFALKHSVLDERSFLNSPKVKSGLYFEEFSFAFISIDSKVDRSFFDDASKIVYYSGNEKKLSDFVEKKF